MKVRIKTAPGVQKPKYETEASAGMDIRSNDTVAMPPNSRRLIKTGLFTELPIGWEFQVRPRSGLAAKKGITVLNAPGTIDADYRGEIGVILANTSNQGFLVEKGMRIAQLVLKKVEQVEWEDAEELSETSRGEGGFGSTGSN
jgi:dUTP pyrophosphatase